jgi:hypothetical protein
VGIEEGVEEGGGEEEGEEGLAINSSLSVRGAFISSIL